MTSAPARGPLGRAPIVLVLPALLGLAFVTLPLVGLLVRTPWATLRSNVTDPLVLDALRLSVIASTGAAAIAAVVGIPLAWLLTRTDVPGRSLIRALVLVPLVLPPVVGGVALLLAFGPRGVVGGWLESVGIVLPFSTAGTVVAAAFVALPFLVLSVEGALAGLAADHEDVAATLGAGRLRTFVTVTLPMVAPAVLSGLLLAWARALGEFGATLTFAGNLPGVTQTMPLAVYQSLSVAPRTSLALSVLLLAVSVAIVVGLHGRWLPALVRRP